MPNNNTRTSLLYEQRLYYKYTFQNIKNEIDFWANERYYGKLDKQSVPFYLNKQFLKSISISRVDYQMTINIVGGETVPSSKLSAGERQLLAVAVLWALAKLSGRQLPTVIDTPLGRLDSKHRKFFVENYFPNAGHQVILLSTDEEIVGGYYNSLKNSIAKEYLVEYDEEEQSSVITNGYFNQAKVLA